MSELHKNIKRNNNSFDRKYFKNHFLLQQLMFYKGLK